MGIFINSSTLEDASHRLDVLGNNVANVNTAGFKRSSFSEELKKASGSPYYKAGINQDFSQGNITGTTNPLDMAISGNSLFRLDTRGGITYTRNGQFSLSKDNYIVDPFGSKLTGYKLGDNGKIDYSQLADLKIDTGLSKAVATSKLGLKTSLDSRLEPVLSSIKFDPSDPNSYSNSTFTSVFDSLGDQHNVQNFFRKVSDISDANGNFSTWKMYTIVDNKIEDIPPTSTLVFDNSIGKLDTVIDSAGNTLKFDKTLERLKTFTKAGETTPTVIEYQNNIAINEPARSIIYSNPIASNAIKSVEFSIDFSGSIQNAHDFAVDTTQNGKSVAEMTGYKVNNDGKIEAIYANGTTAEMGQVVLVKFNNLNGLNSIANNQWTESSDSGTPQIGTAADPSFGSIQGAATESSNVDLTVEMVKLIAAQRAFQSQAEVVKKADETIQNVIRIGG